MKFCILFKLSSCPRYCLLIGSQLTTWSQGNLHYIRLHSSLAQSRIFLPIAQSCAALFCCCLAIRASSLGCLVGNKCEINNYRSFVGPLNSEELFLLDHCQWFVFSSSISSETNQKIFSGHAGSFRQR